MAFRRTISQAELGAKLTDADRQKHGRTFSARTGGWTEKTTDDKPTAGTGTTDQDATGARKWWK